MSENEDGKKREYEVAATELVDLEDFRKYMAEEEEEEAQRDAEPEVSSPSPAAEDHHATNYVSPRASASEENKTDNAKLAAILGIVSLIPGLGLLLGPAAIAVANKQKSEISAGRANPGGLQQTNIGLYLGSIGTALSILLVVYVMVS